MPTTSLHSAHVHLTTVYVGDRRSAPISLDSPAPASDIPNMADIFKIVRTQAEANAKLTDALLTAVDRQRHKIGYLKRKLETNPAATTEADTVTADPVPAAPAVAATDAVAVAPSPRQRVIQLSAQDAIEIEKRRSPDNVQVPPDCVADVWLKLYNIYNDEVATTAAYNLLPKGSATPKPSPRPRSSSAARTTQKAPNPPKDDRLPPKPDFTWVPSSQLPYFMDKFNSLKEEHLCTNPNELSKEMMQYAFHFYYNAKRIFYNRVDVSFGDGTDFLTFTNSDFLRKIYKDKLLACDVILNDLHNCKRETATWYEGTVLRECPVPASPMDSKSIATFTSAIKNLGPRPDTRGGDRSIKPTTRQQTFAEFCADIETAADIAFGPNQWKQDMRIPQIVALEHFSTIMRKLMREADNNASTQSWPTFKTWTMSHIDQTPYNEKLHALEQLHRGHCKQRPGQRIQEYTAHMRNVLARAGINTDEERVQWYLQGLEPHISERLRRDPINGGAWKDMDRLATYADDMLANDATLRRSRPFNPADKGIPRPSPHHYNNTVRPDTPWNKYQRSEIRPVPRPFDHRHEDGDGKRQRPEEHRSEYNSQQHPQRRNPWTPVAPSPPQARPFNPPLQDAKVQDRVQPRRQTIASDYQRWNKDLSFADAEFLFNEDRCANCFKKKRDCRATHVNNRCAHAGTSQRLDRRKLP